MKKLSSGSRLSGTWLRSDIVTTPAKAGIVVYMAFAASVLFLGVMTPARQFHAVTFGVQVQDYLTLIVLASVFWIRVGRSGVRIQSDRLVVHNVWRTVRIGWAEIDRFEVIRRPLLGSTVRIVNRQNLGLWCFGLQSRSRHLTPALRQQLATLNDTLIAQQKEARLKRTKPCTPSTGTEVPSFFRLAPRCPWWTSVYYGVPLALAGLMAIAFSSAPELALLVVVVATTRIVRARRDGGPAVATPNKSPERPARRTKTVPAAV